MEKVILPRKVAEALEEAKGSYGGDIDMIAWNIPREDRSDVWFWNVLYEFSLHNGGFLKLIDALRYGYDIEPETITVTITTEMQDQIREYFNRLDPSKDPSIREFIDGERLGVMATLNKLGIKIPGVND